MFWAFSRLQNEAQGDKMVLTCHYSSNEHTHVGTERAGPEQAQGTVSLPATGSNKDQTQNIIRVRVNLAKFKAYYLFPFL